MSTRVRLEVCPQKRGARPWKLTKNGHKVGEMLTQGLAIHAARTLANELVVRGGTVTLKIKRPDGTIREERTYPRSSDPRRSRS
jgi:hypothetical protein